MNERTRSFHPGSGNNEPQPDKVYLSPLEQDLAALSKVAGSFKIRAFRVGDASRKSDASGKTGDASRKWHCWEPSKLSTPFLIRSKLDQRVLGVGSLG